ncbi:low molecular weight protein-tyrosine-phosphatase [Brackiella oedipodis]|uniref:low molecular weight protein-tyrosine-phosphatase n=1 Tax=Brackiella oedipodis TaxID=124225 RepID=UPI00048B5E68|nr:low molecular weight protein-tyrosine-phosphatase [Brackiella oedipodis]
MVTKVLFVCTGGICRAPSAAAVLRRLVNEADLQDQIQIDCAATHDYHLGASPDGRARFVARKRGYDISGIKVRLVQASDFQDFDMILVMDWENLSKMKQLCPRPLQHKLRLLMRYANDYEEATVPDPFYGGLDAFFKMYDYLADSCQGVFEIISGRYRSSQVA